MSARVKLLDAAAALAVREGVTALGVERVVKEAGVSKGSFFYHFPTKEEMVRALLDHVAQSCMDEVEAAIADGARFSDAMIEMVVRELTENGALIAVLVSSVALDPTLRAKLTERSQTWRARMIEEDGLPPERADLLRIAIDGAMIGAVLYEPAGARERAQNAERILRDILRR